MELQVSITVLFFVHNPVGAFVGHGSALLEAGARDFRLLDVVCHPSNVVGGNVKVGQRGAEKPNRERENEELEGEKGIIRKRTASCIVPRKRPRDRFRTLDTERVKADVEGGQRGAEQIKPNRNAEKRG